MLKNAFAGQKKRPTERELSSALGEADVLWKDLVADLKHDLKLDAEQWNSYSVKAGWSLRLQLKKRNIVYLSPSTGFFLASFALGDTAVAAARKAKLPTAILKIIDEAKRYAEGTAVRIEVRAATDTNVVKTLAKIKLEN
jgi:uncharacterized protein DUF3788